MPGPKSLFYTDPPMSSKKKTAVGVTGAGRKAARGAKKAAVVKKAAPKKAAPKKAAPKKAAPKKAAPRKAAPK